jgi:NAD(P)-dependent dehydrogenase (short-subunit alcohol dehydrogenase family)
MEADAARAGGRLAGLTALVTGAGSGIGQAIAHLFAAEGAAILAVGRREAPVAATAAAIRDAGGIAAAAPVDVADEAAVRALLERLPELLGPRLDVLVNAAGTGSTTTAADTPLEVWERVFAVNARGTFLMSKHALPLLRASHGAIVNVGSVAGIVGLRNRAAYCASKGAVAALTRAMAIDHVREGVRVNCLCPGTTDTPWVARLVAEQGESLDALAARQPLGRLATAEEIADAALYLASPSASFVTGSQLVVDGGLTAG